MSTLRLILIYTAYLCLGCVIAQRQDHPTGQFYYLEGYVSEINTPKHGNEKTKELLKEFNEMSSNKEAVSFEDNHFWFKREIHIEEAQALPKTSQDKNLTTAGLTHVGSAVCRIQMMADLPDWEYRLILFHEYCHCMGYPDLYGMRYRHDLMYYISEPFLDEGSVKWYSEDIGIKVHKWKSLRNLNLSIKLTK